MQKEANEKKNWKKILLSKENVGLIWILPALALLCVFCLYPVISAFYHSFTDWDGGMHADIVWFANYAEIFQDRLFWISLLNVVILTVVGMIIGNAASIFLAELMYNLRSKLSGVYRFLFVLPAMVPSIVVLLLWQKLILSGSSTGVMNTILRWFGLPSSEWFASKNTFVVFLSIFLYGFPWMGGTSFLIYLAGLNGIDPSIIEATKRLGMYDETVFIVTADHGGTGTGHGSTSMEEMQTPFVIFGPGVKRGHEITSAVMRYDTAPTIAYIFGAACPDVWRGKAVREAFE